MVLIMSTLMNMEFVHALNPLYAFPIVAVILCAFIVYAFGFKSPVQPPSFDAIDEEKKSTKKRKTKETSKVKVVQNGKLNGSNLNKNQTSVSNKKKESEKLPADKTVTEKPLNEKKMTKKSKLSSEKKVSQEKKKDSFSQEDTGEGGWVQLISKRGRRNLRRDEATNVERQTCIVKPVQNLQNNKSDEIILSEEIPKPDVIVDSVLEKKFGLRDDKNDFVPNIENCKEKVIIIEDCKTVDVSIEKTAFEVNVIKNEKSDEISTKSKKKKKKSTEVYSKEINSNNVINPETATEQMISEISAPLNSTTNSSVATETSETFGKTEEHHSKETKTSNVVFDELAGLYPEPKEQRKKKKVRRDH